MCIRDRITSELTNSEGRVIPLGVYARKSLMPFVDAEDMFELTRQGFEFYEEQFKTPYPFEKYDQLFVPEFNAGAMEKMCIRDSRPPAVRSPRCPQ